MKKWILLGVAAAIALLLVVFGPGLLDLYRLDRFVAESTQAYEADRGPWPHVTDACVNCHGVQGNSAHQGYPSLAGQPAPYLADQLRKFANGQRVNPNMGPLSMAMSDAEIELYANHFARQPARPNGSFQPDAALVEKGKTLVAAGHCATCHGERLMGQGEFPRLAGQGYDYLMAQFAAFASGTRIEATGTMKNIAAKTPPGDLEAMVHYMASLVPAKP